MLGDQLSVSIHVSGRGWQTRLSRRQNSGHGSTWLLEESSTETLQRRALSNQKLFEHKIDRKTALCATTCRNAFPIILNNRFKNVTFRVIVRARPRRRGVFRRGRGRRRGLRRGCFLIVVLQAKIHEGCFGSEPNTGTNFALIAIM